MPFRLLFRRRNLWHGALATLGLMTAASAAAHGGYDPRLKLALSEVNLRVEISIPTSDLLEFDTNDDGKLQKSEFEAQTMDVALWIESRLSLKNKAGDRISPNFSDAAIVDGDHFKASDPITHIKIRRRYTVKGLIEPLALSTELYSVLPVLMFSKAGQFEKIVPIKLCLETLKKTTCRPL